MAEETYRMGEAASALGVRVETLRRWERDGKLKTKRSSGGQRLVAASEVARLLNERRGKAPPATMGGRKPLPRGVTPPEKRTPPPPGGVQARPPRVRAR